MLRKLMTILTALLILSFSLATEAHACGGYASLSPEDEVAIAAVEETARALQVQADEAHAAVEQQSAAITAAGGPEAKAAQAMLLELSRLEAIAASKLSLAQVVQDHASKVYFDAMDRAMQKEREKFGLTGGLEDIKAAAQ